MATATAIPNGYTNTGTYYFSQNTSYPITNAYNDANHTSSYARLTLVSNKNSSRTSTIYIEFDKSSIESIPSNATIRSVAANVRYAISNTTYVSAVSLQLYSNTTAKGTAVTTRSTTSATSGGTKYSISAGDWTLSQLGNLRLYISATHNKSTNSGYIYLYGADVTVTYTVPTTNYSVSVSTSSDTSYYTYPKDASSVQSGSYPQVYIQGNLNDISVTDNNVDVTSSLTYHHDEEFDYDFYDYYLYTISNIQANHTIVVGHSTQTTTYTITATSSESDLSGSIGISPIDSGVVGAGRDAEVIISKTSPLGTLYVYDNGVDVTSSFIIGSETYSGTTYYYAYYDLENVSANHLIVFSHTALVTDSHIRVKQNGSWVTAIKLLVKQNGSWVEGTIKVKQNGNWN